MDRIDLLFATAIAALSIAILILVCFAAAGWAGWLG